MTALSRRPAKQGILDLEDAVGRADLIVVVRLVDMSEAKIVHGGKSEVITQQFKFEPVRALKGIFARDALLLTGQDLGIYQFSDSSEKLEPGQLLLLLLGRQGPGYLNCNTAGTLEQSIPRLRDQADPLLPAVEGLIASSQKRDREAKVMALLAALRKAKDRDAVPLMLALSRRALLAAQTPDSMETIAGFLGHNSAEIREVAAKTLGTLLSADYFQQADSHDKAVKALVTALDAAGTDLAVRVAALDALGSAGESARRSDSAMAWLKVDRTATTFKEHAARIRAIGETGRADQTAAIATFLEQLPLDSPPEIQEAAGRALGRLDGKEATRHLLKRLTSKSDAGLEIVSEIALLGDLKAEIAAPALLEAANRIEAHSERLAFATACAKVADPSLVPALGPMLDPRYSDVRYYATEALRKIDTDEAASMVWPSLSQETDLVRKLQLAEFLGRHGFRGGYPYAIEHMSAPMLQHVAIDALASIREPKAIPELRKILETSNDVGWNSAAIRALGRLGQNDLAPRMLELAGDRKNPLATPAMIALCDLGEAKALPIVLDALASRNDNVVDDAIQASQKLLAAPNVQGDAVRDRLAALLADSDTSQVVRSTAFNALLALKDPRLGPALATAVRDAGLEHSDLLLRIEQTLSTRKEKLNLK